MEKNEVPKVVLNYTQVNNPTQVVNEPYENSVQTIGRVAKECAEKPGKLMDAAVSFVNAFWTGLFKGLWLVAKNGILPLFIFYQLFFTLIALHSGHSLGYSVKMPFVFLIEVSMFFIRQAPDLFHTFAPLLIMAFSGLAASYIFACMLARSIYKNDYEKRKAARRAIFFTVGAAFPFRDRKGDEGGTRKGRGAVMKNSEKRTNQLSRMFEILGMINSGKQCTRGGLAEYFEVSERTISRDLSLMSKLFPVYYDTETGRYSFAGDYSFKDVNLSPEEIKALLMCRLIASNLGEPIANSIDSLMMKLKVGLGKKSSETMEKVSARYAFDGEPLEYISAAQRWVDLIQQALDKKLSISITNADMEESIETIDPYGFFIRSGRVCFVAYSHNKNEVAIYAVHRIKSIKQTNMNYQIPSSFSIDNFLKSNKEAVHKIDVDRLTWTLEWLDNIIEQYETRKFVWVMSTIARIYQERISDLRQALGCTVEEIKRAGNPLSFEKESTVIKSMEKVLDGWERTKSAFEKTVQKCPLREFDDAIHDQFKKLREMDVNKEFKDLLGAYEISLKNNHEKAIEAIDRARVKLKDGTYDNELRAERKEVINDESGD